MRLNEFTRGYIHIYCGDGKGKTTAAMGLCIRAAGNAKKVLVVQFLKSNTSGELNILKGIPAVTVIDSPDHIKFTIDMTGEEKAAIKTHYEKLFGDIALKSKEYDMLILDEIIYTVDAGLFSENLLIDFLQNKPDKLEVVMTGQNPSEKLKQISDYISEIKKIKHPYDQGLRSRPGIEK